MKRRDFLSRAAALPLLLRTATSRSETTTPAKTAATPVASFATPMHTRYELTRNRVIHGTDPTYTPDFVLQDVSGTPGRRFTEFSGDVSGRWIGALSVSSAVYGDKFAQLDEVVRRTIALQHPDGYFGKEFHYDNPNDLDLALLWGNGRLLIGLIEYYHLTKSAEALASARKLGDFLVRLGPKYNSKKIADDFGAAHFASSYICWTQQTEGLAALYAATKDTRYSKLCGEIAERMERRPGDHVHGYLSSLRGAVDLYNATGDTKYLKLVEAKYEGVIASGDVLITGGVPEAWSPKKRRTEGCAECDWLRLNLQLWQATGNTKYIEMAEKVVFNEFAMNQFATGDFGHAVLDEHAVTKQVMIRAWWCCTLHGLRAFPDVTRSTFRQQGTSISYDLPVDGYINADGISLRSTSTLHKNGMTSIHVIRAGGHSLSIRKPSWSSDVAIRKNGVAVTGNTIASLKAGDVITVKYAMALRPEQYGKGQAMHFGPWILGAASAVNPGYFNELYPNNRIIQDSIEPSREAATSPFDVPVAATQAKVIPAEYPQQLQEVKLRAVAEQTALPSTPWQIVFDQKDVIS